MSDMEHTESVTRRNFLKLAWGAVGAVALVQAGGVALQFFAPRTVEGAFGGVFEVGAIDDFPSGSVTAFNSGRFFLVRMPDGGFLALYRKCTHLGCAVPWDHGRQQFVCPCHASAFEMDGQVINPPAPRPLDRFAVTIVDGVIRVDTGAAIQRDHTAPDELVYA